MLARIIVIQDPFYNKVISFMSGVNFQRFECFDIVMSVHSGILRNFMLIYYIVPL